MSYYIYYRTSYQYPYRDNYPRTCYEDPEYIHGESLIDLKNKIIEFINNYSLSIANSLASYYNYNTCIAKLEAGKWPESLSENGLEFITPIFYADDEFEDTNYTDLFREQLKVDTLNRFKAKKSEIENANKIAKERKEAEERQLLEKLLLKYPK